MHELSIASGLVGKLLQFSTEHPDRTLIEVRVAIGELSHIEEQQLKFCYESITKDTPLDGSSLVIEKVPAMVNCPHCSYRGRPDYWDEALSIAPVITMRCPQCGKSVDAIEGHECAIKSVKFVEPHRAPTA
jgi:hydrogenase nickel incorporation protein HypA/HybF